MPAASALAIAIPLIFFGDSLAVGLSTAHGNSLGAVARVGWGLSGRQDPAWEAERANALARLHPGSVIVVEVGTNDLPLRDPRVYAARVDLVADALGRGGQRVLWLGLPAFCGPSAWRNAAGSALNAVVRGVIGGRQNFAWADSHPYTADCRAKYSDGVHLRDYRSWAEHVSQQIER